jgi:AmpD protein
MIVDAAGRVDAARYLASPNSDERPSGEAVTLLVIHSISLPPGEFGGDGIVRLFTNELDCTAHPYYRTLAGMRVSAHFLIRRPGELLQFVPCAKRAWHAGASAWRGRSRCNDFSIGIELEGADDVPYTEPQYRVLAELTRALQSAYPIADIAGHYDVAPARKTDPGPGFDWSRFRSSIV